MSDKLQAIQELKRRGKLPPQLEAAYAEAVKRGLIEDVAPKKAAPQVSGLESGLRGAYQGLTMGHGDEIAGALQAPFRSEPLAEAYAKARDEMRAGNKAAAAANPGLYHGAELAGGVGSFFVPGMGGAKIANATSKLATKLAGEGMASKMLASGMTGAGYGGVSGLGNAEGDLGQQAMSAGTGALVGAGIGAALPPALATGQAILSKPINTVRSWASPRRVAAEKIAEAFIRDAGGGRPNFVANTPAALPTNIMADAGGENVRGIVRAFVNRPNAQKTKFQDALNDRAENQWQAIQGGLAQHMADPRAFYQSGKDLIAQRAKDAGPAYAEAWKGDFQPSDRLFKLFEHDGNGKFARPTVAKIAAQLNGKLRDAHGMDDEIANLVVSQPLQYLHAFKVILDRQINKAQKAAALGQSADKMDYGQLVGLKKYLIQGIKESEGEGAKRYLAANEQFAGHSKLNAALEAGFEDMKKGDIMPEAVKATLKGMTESEREMYRLGAARAWNVKNLGPAEANDRVKAQWSSPLRQQLMDVLFPSPEARSAFGKTLDTLAQQVKTRQAAQGNSTTAGQLLEQQAADKPAEIATDVLKNVVQSNFGGALKAIGNGASWLGSNNPRVAEEGLKLLGQPIAQGARAIPKAIQDAMEQNAITQARLQALSQGITRGAVNMVPGRVTAPDPYDPTSAFPLMPR